MNYHEIYIHMTKRQSAGLDVFTIGHSTHPIGEFIPTTQVVVDGGRRDPALVGNGADRQAVQRRPRHDAQCRIHHVGHGDGLRLRPTTASRHSGPVWLVSRHPIMP